METNRWDTLEELFDRMLQLPPEQWAASLDEACGHDAEQRAELLSLLEHYRDASSFFEEVRTSLATPSLEALEKTYDRSGMRFSHYKVLGKLGGGGMGIVYRAWDHRLERIVALKFLPPHLSTDAEAKERFSAEAKAASALVHPNICTIHEIDETADGELFIVMACYDGETLKKKIARGPLPLDDALNYAIQIARGLAKAHAADIVHRDVKPANVIVDGDGLVRILDFGLAKMADVHLTKTGKTMGTAAYLSPEQARGIAVDHRADIWALGVVLYEMLTAQRPFRSDHDEALTYFILNEEPQSLTALNPALPASLDRIMTQCLAKDPARRYIAITDLQADLERLAKHIEASTHRPAETVRFEPKKISGRALAGVLATLMLFVMLSFVWKAIRPQADTAASTNQIQLAVLPFENVGGDSTNQAFVEGLRYTVTSKLAGMEKFQNTMSVIPAADVREANIKSPDEAARKLKANIIIEGSIQRMGDMVRLTLNLVDTKTGRVRRPLILDKHVTDLLALQDSVVLQLGKQLDLELDPKSQQVLTSGRTTVPGAFDFYTQGQGYLQRAERAVNIDLAIQLFDHAVAEDSLYALAYAALGQAYWRKYEATRDHQWVDAAIESSEKALVLDDQLAPVHITIGMIYDRTGEHGKAQAAFQRALTLDPLEAAAHRQLARAYYMQGKLDSAEASYKKAIELKPGYWEYYNALGYLYDATGRYGEAIEQYRQVTKLRPDHPWGYNNLAVQYQNTGRLKEAIALYRQASVVNPEAKGPTAIAYRNLGSIYYGQNEFGDAVLMYEKAHAINDLDLQGWGNLANSYHWTGAHEKARTAWLNTILLAEERLVVNPRQVDALEQLASAHAKLGQRDQAFVYVGRLLALKHKEAATLEVIAKVYEILGERTLALQYLGKALENNLSLSVIETSAWLDTLRADPRYPDIIQPYTE